MSISKLKVALLQHFISKGGLFNEFNFLVHTECDKKFITDYNITVK